MASLPQDSWRASLGGELIIRVVVIVYRNLGDWGLILFVKINNIIQLNESSWNNTVSVVGI